MYSYEIAMFLKKFSPPPCRVTPPCELFCLHFTCNFADAYEISTVLAYAAGNNDCVIIR